MTFCERRSTLAAGYTWTFIRIAQIGDYFSIFGILVKPIKAKIMSHRHAFTLRHRIIYSEWRRQRLKKEKHAHFLHTHTLIVVSMVLKAYVVLSQWVLVHGCCAHLLEPVRQFYTIPRKRTRACFANYVTCLLCALCTEWLNASHKFTHVSIYMYLRMYFACLNAYVLCARLGPVQQMRFTCCCLYLYASLCIMGLVATGLNDVNISTTSTEFVHATKIT